MLGAIAFFLTCTAFFLYLYWADEREGRKQNEWRKTAIDYLERCWAKSRSKNHE